MKKYILTLFIFLLCLLQAVAQEPISGTVLSSATQAPISGATVKIKGLSMAVSTNEQGQFKIQAINHNFTIQVSFIGYKTKEVDITIPIKGSLTILMDTASTNLAEVLVSTGYQTLPKERVTGSFTQIDHKTFDQQVGTDVLSRLIGVAGGLTVDKGTNSNGKIIVRGLGSILGPTDPLIVLDNFPYNGDINNINPNDVENITVLKDAAAASIWGAKAGNGVIVITTKKGKFNQPVAIEFNVNVVSANKPDLSYIKQMSTSDFIDVEKMLFKQGYYNSQFTDPSKQPLTPVVEILLKEQNGTLSANDADAQINSLRGLDIRNDFNKYMYQRSFNQQYALNLHGGTNVFNWVSSGGYDEDISDLSADYNRINLRFQDNYRPVRDLLITTGVIFTQSKSGSGKPGYGDVTNKNGLYFFPYAQFADTKGNPVPLVKDYEQNYVQTAGNGLLKDWNYYALTDYKHTPATTKISDVLINTGINYRIIGGLSADLKYQYERQQTNLRNLWDQDSYFARNLVNSFTEIDGAGDVTNIIPSGGIIDLGSETINSNNLRGQLGYNQNWGKHELSVIAGGEIRSAHTTSDRYRFYGYDNNLLTYGNVDYANPYPDFTSGNYNFIPDNRDISDLTTRYVSTYANAAYTYNRKYTLTLSGRRDASNLFGLNTNDQWNPFWSAGGAWNLSEEPFYKVSFLPYLRARATYGISGNIDPAMVAATTIYYVSTSPYTHKPLAQITNNYNPDLKWETSRMLNLGIDFKTTENRLTGTVEYYQKKGSDLFGTAILDYTGGIGPQAIKNTASMSGQGLDIELNTRNLNGKIKWLTTVNFSLYQDKVTDYYLNSLQGSNFITSTSNVPIAGVAGKPVYSIFAYKWAGLDPQTGAPRGYLNGQVSEDYNAITGSGTQVSDLKYFGSAIPTKFGSVINTFSYQHFTLNFSMVYKLGYYFRRSSINYSNLYANWQGHLDYALRWQKPGDEAHTNVPSIVYPATQARDDFYTGSAVLVDKGDHVRLQYVNFGYDLITATSKRTAFKSLQLYLNASNLGILWRANKDHIDPDFNYGTYPLVTPKTFAIGVRGSF